MTTAATLLFAQETVQGNETETSQLNIQSPSSSNENLRVGSFGDDRITGTNEADIIVGLSGSVTMNGGQGNDKIQGNQDSDKIYGD